MFLQPFFAEGYFQNTKERQRAQCTSPQLLTWRKLPEPRVQEAWVGAHASMECASISDLAPLREGWRLAIQIEMRFQVSPRCVPANVAARRIGLSESVFLQHEPRLRQYGFPLPDPVTGNYDLVAIDAWLDRRSGLSQQALRAIDAADGFEQRLAQIG